MSQQPQPQPPRAQPQSSRRVQAPAPIYITVWQDGNPHSLCFAINGATHDMDEVISTLSDPQVFGNDIVDSVRGDDDWLHYYPPLGPLIARGRMQEAAERGEGETVSPIVMDSDDDDGNGGND